MGEDIVPHPGGHRDDPASPETVDVSGGVCEREEEGERGREREKEREKEGERERERGEREREMCAVITLDMHIISNSPIRISSLERTSASSYQRSLLILTL